MSIMITDNLNYTHVIYKMRLYFIMIIFIASTNQIMYHYEIQLTNISTSF